MIGKAIAYFLLLLISNECSSIRKKQYSIPNQQDVTVIDKDNNCLSSPEDICVDIYVEQMVDSNKMKHGQLLISELTTPLFGLIKRSVRVKLIDSKRLLK